jgi:hypothetical protein
MFGPGVGAGLSQFTLQTPMFVSAALAALGWVFTWWKFREPVRAKATNTPAQDEKPSEGKQEAVPPLSAQDGQGDAKATSQTRTLMVLLCVVSLTGVLGFSAYLYFFGIFIFDQFGYGSLEFGFISMAVSVLSVVNQMGTYTAAQKRIGNHGLNIIGSLLMALGLMLLAICGGDARAFRGVPLMCIGLVVMGLGTSYSTPASTALLSQYTPPSQQGSIMGISQSLQALARTIGPLMWGAIYTINNSLPFAVGAVSGLITTILCIVAYLLHRRLPPDHKPAPAVETDRMTEEGDVELAAFPQDGESELVTALRMEIARLRRKLEEYEASTMTLPVEFDAVVMTSHS